MGACLELDAARHVLAMGELQQLLLQVNIAASSRRRHSFSDNRCNEIPPSRQLTFTC